MNFDYQIKIDKYVNKYIEIPFSYRNSNITIKIYQHFITASGIDKQSLFYFCRHLNIENLDRNNIKFKITDNNIFLYFKCYMNNDFTINIKHVKNKLFFKFYKNNTLSKRAFCYINKENKKIYQNSAHIVLKHLFNHKDVKKYNVIKKSNEEIYIDNEKTNEKFLISIFNENIIKMRYSIDGEETILYNNTKNSLYHINNFDFFDFILGTYNVSKKEIEQIKLLKKLNKF